ncbi:hypothetical protein AGDE_05898 [Angomonas deanei]|uniref:Uncharacterized protein n=1 Tax=Angomonas deanei TaxID=59799 RepID=A0A7G2CKF6_9TRYP|nr:hypothetical protein AGDE_05898 [Angomonas deanei]CAD2219431.1 hypothetical protein, conserved [Angomonas deanei]|eukprot:EPY38034.1 hypothetical protein AGDE_05898 [Angomonas deanei]
MSAMLGKPQAALEAMRLAEASEVKVSLECYYWVLYAIRDVPHLSDFVMDLFGQLHPRGLTPDYLLFTMAFGFCALNADGDLAQALYSQHFIHTDINPTPEMVLFFCQACAQCSNPTVHMLSSCDALMDRLEETGSVKDNMVEIYDQYLELAATLGAVSSAFSRLKVLVNYGKEINTRMLNSLLLAASNADKDSCSASLVTEVYDMFRFLGVPANEDTLKALAFCTEKFDLSEAVGQWAQNMLEQLERQRSGEPLTEEERRAALIQEGHDEKVHVVVAPPHRVRQLQVAWNLRPRDTMLRRFGQNTKPKREEAVGSMLGSVIPFGRSPGERRV